MQQKNKILVDLDVVTVAFWDNKELAIKFLNRIKSEEFTLYTPFIITDLVAKWKHESLRNNIINFYEVYSDFNLDYLVTFNRKHLRDKEQIINEVLKKYGIKTIKIVLPSEI